MIDMIQIDDTLVSLDVIERHFLCDLAHCKGECCVEGDAGAPLEEEEFHKLREILPEIWNDLSPKAQEVINKQGVGYIDEDGDIVTSIVDGKDCVFQVCFTDPNQGVNAAKFLAEKYADEKFVLFYNSGDAYSSGIADSFKAQAAESKLEIVDEETFKDDSATSFTNQLTKAKQAGATMIFAPIYYTPASVLLKNAKDMGYDVKMMGCDGMDGILGVEGFDTSLAEGLLLMTPFSADDEKNADFVNAYKDKYGDTPDQFAADAYDGVHAVAEAVKEAGLGVDADPTEAAEKLSKAMLKITVDGLTGKLTWNDKGQVQKEPTAYIITDGKYVQA